MRIELILPRKTTLSDVVGIKEHFLPSLLAAPSISARPANSMGTMSRLARRPALNFMSKVMQMRSKSSSRIFYPRTVGNDDLSIPKSYAEAVKTGIKS